MVRPSTSAAWWLAFALTLGLAAFQRVTGPTRPLRGTVVVSSTSVAYRLLRSHGGPGDLAVRIEAPDGISGTLAWRRYPTSEPWRGVPLRREGGKLIAGVPHQPPAGKVEYRVVLEAVGSPRATVPPDRAAVARFKGAVPAALLAPHVAAMFAAMLVATRAVISAAVGRASELRRAVLIAFGLLVLGGLILGPLVQRYAFGAYWTGWPVGEDLTDTKTLVAVLAWVPAVAAVVGRRSRLVGAAVVCGWMVMMGVFLIPHSTRGSQIDWSAVPVSESREPSR